ncbi:MAG: hypothetical protein KUG77_26815 [Nannocystaceae bacterium]|nr:hypothetical protein [Nannocystaceae bacterium]
MLWATRVEPGFGGGGSVFLAVLTGAAIGWFGTECLVAVTEGIDEVSE